MYIPTKNNYQKSRYFRLNNFSFSLEEVVGEKGVILCRGVSPIYKRENGVQTTEIIGTEYRCLAPDKDNTAFKLRCYSKEPALTPDDFTKKYFFRLKVKSFKGKFVIWNGKDYFIAYAEEVSI